MLPQLCKCSLILPFSKTGLVFGTRRSTAGVWKDPGVYIAENLGRLN